MLETTDSPIVLVVDDDAPIRTFARRTLEPAGYRVLESGDGNDAVKRLEGGVSVDLVLADIDMPGLSGEEMVRRIRAKRPDLKVLYVTAHIDRLLTQRSTLWAGEAFLEKPFTHAGLLEAVALLLYGSLQKPKPRKDPANPS